MSGDFSLRTNFVRQTADLGQRAVCVQRDAGLRSPSARRQTTLIKARSDVKRAACGGLSVCLRSSFPTRCSALLDLLQYFMACRVRGSSAPQRATSTYFFGACRRGGAVRRRAGVSTNVCVDEEDGEHDVHYEQLLSEHSLRNRRVCLIPNTFL